jgi:signal transduction histidine kinase
MSREIERLLFQATRELLMNVVKHSKAQNATVKFSSRGQKVRIEVSDDGTGFDIKKTFQPDLKGGYGLYSIRERLRHIGGQLSIKSKPGQGTTIIVSAPREIEK